MTNVAHEPKSLSTTGLKGENTSEGHLISQLSIFLVVISLKFDCRTGCRLTTVARCRTSSQNIGIRKVAPEFFNVPKIPKTAPENGCNVPKLRFVCKCVDKTSFTLFGLIVLMSCQVLLGW